MPTNAFDVFVQGMQQQAANTQDMGRLQLQVALSQWEQKKRAEEAVLADARDLERQLTVTKENARLNAEAQRRAKSDARDLQVENQIFNAALSKINNDAADSREDKKLKEAEARASRDREMKSEMAAASARDLRQRATEMRESAINDLATVGQRARSPEAAMEATHNLLQTGSITRDQAAVLSGLASKGNLDTFQSQLDTYAKSATGWFGGDTDKSTAIRNALASSVENRAQQLQQAALVNMQLVDNSIRDYDKQAAELAQYILPKHRASLEPTKPAAAPAGGQATDAPRSEADRFKAMLGGGRPQAAAQPQPEWPSLSVPAGTIPSEPQGYYAGVPGPINKSGIRMEPSLLNKARLLVLGPSAEEAAAMQLPSVQEVQGMLPANQPTQQTRLQPSDLRMALQQYIMATQRGDTVKSQQLGSAIEELRSQFSGGQHEPINLQNATQALAALQQQSVATQ